MLDVALLGVLWLFWQVQLGTLSFVVEALAIAVGSMALLGIGGAFLFLAGRLLGLLVDSLRSVNVPVRWSGGFARVSWLIPYANLVFPFLITRDILRGYRAFDRHRGFSTLGGPLACCWPWQRRNLRRCVWNRAA